MATSGGPNTTTEGLVFGYDNGYPIADTAQSLRFNKGEPTENLVGNSTFIGTSGTQTQGVSPAGWVFSGESESTGFQFYNSNTSPIPLKFPNEGAVVTTGPGDNSNRRIYFRRTDLLGNTTYSISCWMYFSRAFNSAWAKFQYDSSNTNVFSGYFDNFSTYASTYGYGLDEWFLWKGSFTTEATTEKSYWGPVISRTADVLVGMQRMQIEVKDYPTPFIQGTRSVSGSLIDLTRTHDIDLSNASFDSNAQLEFDGTDDFVRIPYTATDLDGDPLFSVEAVVKRTGTLSNSGFWGIGGDGSGAGINSYVHGAGPNKVTIDLWGTATFRTDVDYPLNEYIHVVWVKKETGFSTSTIIIYINGVAYTGNDFTAIRGSSHTPSLNTSTSGKGLVLGRVGPATSLYHGSVELPLIKFYNNALTAEKVKQNYNAIKNRFNI